MKELFVAMATVGFLALTAYILPPVISRLRALKPVKENKTDAKVGDPPAQTVFVWVRIGEDLFRKVKAVMKGNSILTKNETWVIDNPKPLRVIEGRRVRQYLILDSRTQAAYEFPEYDKREENKIRLRITDPKFLKTYIGSNVLSKMFAKLQVSRWELLTYLLVGMTITYLFQFFILPIMGYQVVISPAR